MSDPREKGIIDFLLAEIEPVFDFYSGEKSYPASARLHDGTYLPCVAFKPASRLVDRAIRKFEEAKDGTARITYREMVHLQCCIHNMISPHNVEIVTRSPYALSAQHLEILHSAFEALQLDPVGNYLPFVAEMVDGKRFNFYFVPETQFLDIPEGYDATQIVGINPNRTLPDKRYGHKLTFECYLSSL